MNSETVPRIPLQLSSNCVVASIQVDLRKDVIEQFRKDLLAFLQSTGAAGVILDISGVHVMDVEDFNGIRHTIAMATLMGAISVIAGFRPGVVSALVELGAEIDDIQAVQNLDDAFRLMVELQEAKKNQRDVQDDE